MLSRIDTKKIGDVTIVYCLDIKLNDEYTIQEWGDQITAVVESGECKKLVVDFGKVKFMSSSALRVLITLQKKTDVYKIPFLLCSLCDDILEIFKITNLDSVFEIRKGTEEAIRSIPYLGTH